MTRKAKSRGKQRCNSPGGKAKRKTCGVTKRNQKGSGFDIQNLIGKTGIEWHIPGYQYTAPGTHLEKRLKRRDPGINRLDRIAKQHDIAYSKAKSVKDKWDADKKMVDSINKLPGRKTPTEFIMKHIINAKRKLKL